MKTKLALATLTALLLTSGLASAQRTCNANPGWWESPGLLPVFSGEKGTPRDGRLQFPGLVVDRVRERDADRHENQAAADALVPDL
jgi:hypothetical protein